TTDPPRPVGTAVRERLSGSNRVLIDRRVICLMSYRVVGKNSLPVSGPPRDLDTTEAAGFEDLIRRVRTGEEEAAAELVRLYEPASRRVVRVPLRDPRLRRVLDSTDICQSVLATFFVRANLGQYELDTPEQLLRLLASIARHKVTNQAHRHQADR